MPAAHPPGPAPDRRLRPAGGGAGQRRRGGLRRARRAGRRGARLTFAELGPGGRRRGGPPGPARRRQGRRGLPPAARRPSTTPCSTPPCMRLGAITSGINPRMGAGEVASIIERAAPVARWSSTPTRASLPAPGPVAIAQPRRGRGGVGRRAARVAGPSSTPRDPVAVVWTSGTTGRPKGALFDHANLAAVARGTDVLSQPGDRRLSPLPFAHVGYMTRAWDEIAQRRDDRHHADALAGRRRHPDHGRRAGHRGPGRADPVGADAGQPTSSTAPTSARCASPARARRG